MVFVHRDPVKVLLSVAKLTEVVRRPFTRRLDPQEIGRQESLRWLEGTEQMIADRRRCRLAGAGAARAPQGAGGGPGRHGRQPVSSLRTHPPSDAAAAVGRYARQRPNGGYGPRDYHFEDHGLDGGQEREKFSRYLAHFGIDRE